MALIPGTRIGPYEILSELGAGGMGEVYRALDTILKRQVALKVLPPEVANSTDRVARFQREAEVLAALNHPNIAHLYGLERANGTVALVMELVDGPTLADRCADGPIPLDEALPIAKQIAEAVECAHEQGIIHRDLKPANIKVRSDGTVKVLDFGLAKLTDTSVPTHVGGMTQSPTITKPAMTAAGVILGTAAYMAPEQARGKTVDRRADIWAFGCVLFEMLTARRAFEGESISDVLAAVLKTEPAWNALPIDTPRGLSHLLHRCLDKDPRRRLQAVGEVRVQIEDAINNTLDDRDETTPAAPPTWRRAIPWALATVLTAVLGSVSVWWFSWQHAGPLKPVRLSAELGADVSLAIGPGDDIALSPDGTLLVLAVQKNTIQGSQLYIRALDTLQATALAGTEQAESPFFSPDGQWIGFFAAGKLKKIAVTGGAVVTLCDAPNGRGGSWGEDGAIVFSAPQAGIPLMRVSAAGGTPAVATPLVKDEIGQRWPQAILGGQAVLFTSGGVGAYDDADLIVQRLSNGARTIVHHGGYHGRYVPSSPGSKRGHLVYIRAGTLFAAPFDVERLTTTGPPAPIVEGVYSSPNTGSAQFAVAATGTLSYQAGQGSSGGLPIYWSDRAGHSPPLRVAPANWGNLAFAPDGHRLALHIVQGRPDIWIYDWDREALSRLTAEPGIDTKPVWTVDSRRIVFASDRGNGVLNLYWQLVNGTTTDVRRLTESTHAQLPASWDPSGRLLAFSERNPVTDSDLMILPMEGDESSGWKTGTPRVFLNTPAAEREPMFSPDGKWLAYSSNESGRNEVYVRPFPGPGDRRMVSTTGGTVPTWSRRQHELVYAGPNGQVMVAMYSTAGSVFTSEKPQAWSVDRYIDRSNFSGDVRMVDLHPDGLRVAMAPVPFVRNGTKEDHVTFIFNFLDELNRVAPAGSR